MKKGVNLRAAIGLGSFAVFDLAFLVALVFGIDATSKRFMYIVLGPAILVGLVTGNILSKDYDKYDNYDLIAYLLIVIEMGLWVFFFFLGHAR